MKRLTCLLSIRIFLGLMAELVSSVALEFPCRKQVALKLNGKCKMHSWRTVAMAPAVIVGSKMVTFLRLLENMCLRQNKGLSSQSWVGGEILLSTEKKVSSL